MADRDSDVHICSINAARVYTMMGATIHTAAFKQRFGFIFSILLKISSSKFDLQHMCCGAHRPSERGVLIVP